MIGKTTRLTAAAVALAAMAAACGGSGDDGEDAGDDAANAQAGDEGNGATAVADDELAASVADGWTATVAGDGIKPALAIDSTGTPAMAWLQELTEDGYVSFASADDDWAEERLAKGYLYGPIGLALDGEDRPHVVWHDHETIPFELDAGNLHYAVLDGGSGEWSVETAESEGHDGWDSTLAVRDDGTVFAAGVDPAAFQGEDGVEFYERTPDGTWTIAPVGSGPIEHELNVGLALSPDGTPGVTWSNQPESTLHYAERVDGDWQIEIVPTDGAEAPIFSSLAFDSQGRPHVSFYQPTGEGSGQVFHAVRDGGDWTVEDVGVLEDVLVEDATGARRNTAVAVGSDDTVQLAFTDRSTLQLATRGENGDWSTEEVLSASEQRLLGQQVSLALTDDGTPHLATYEVTGATTGGLSGLVVHVTPG
jgi:hypothetical protein